MADSSYSSKHLIITFESPEIKPTRINLNGQLMGYLNGLINMVLKLFFTETVKWLITGI